MPGAFITFEGIDGCGKSTQLSIAAETLRAQGLQCEVTREPGGTHIAERIRELLLAPEHAEMTDRCELLLYLAARAQHVQERILPQRGAGSVVLCDRFAEATFAYQGFGRGIELEALVWLNEFATGGIEPDLVIVLDIDLDVASRRLRASGKAPDRLEGNSRDFYHRVRMGYKDLAERFASRVAVVDASASVRDVSKAVAEHIGRTLERRERQSSAFESK